MKNQRKRIGILTGGGDVPPLNAVLKAVCSSAERSGVDVIGFWRGWEGVISENGSIKLRSNMIDENRGGTFLKSSRFNLRKDEKNLAKALDKLKRLAIQRLIVIGGEDTLSNALLLHKFPQILISKTIDNDVGLIEQDKEGTLKIMNYFTLGFPTALRKIVSFVSPDQGLRTTAYSHERIIVVESMGMHAGWLALASSLGKPDFIILPEFPLAYERFLSLVIERYSKEKHLIVVVAEGAKWEDGTYISGDSAEMDDFGHPRFRGAAEKLCQRMKKDLSRFFDTRNVNFVNPSYLYRSGAPCDLDKTWGKKLGQKAVDLFLEKADGSFFLAVQRENEKFHIEPYPVGNVHQIDDLHRFVTKPFYTPSRFCATGSALEYFRCLLNG